MFGVVMLKNISLIRAEVAEHSPINLRNEY